jgi:hypothetical protein
MRTTFGSETAYEHVARVLRDFIPQDELDRIVLVGQNEMSQRTIFSSLTGGATILGSVDSGLDRKDIDATKSWLVAIGEPVLTGFGDPTIRGLGYNMYSLEEGNLLQPRNNRISGFENSCSSSEYSDWACGTQTLIKLDKPFPPNASVDLIFELSSSAAQSEIELVLGEVVVSGKLSAGMNAVNVKFGNASEVQSLLVRYVRSESVTAADSDLFLRPIWGYVQTSR